VSQLGLLDGGPVVDLLDVDSCQRKWRVEPGEVFILAGQTEGHVLVCGDSCAREVAELTMRIAGPARRRALVADPPYGIGYKSSSGARVSQGSKKPLPARRVDKQFGADAFDASWLPVWRTAAAPDAVYLFTAWIVSARWREAMTATGWAPKMRIIWDKMAFGMGDLASYGDQTEEVWFWSNTAPAWPKRQGNVWQEARGVALEGGMVGHPTPKPFGVYRRPIEHMTAPGDMVIDPFGGSGPALIVADGLRRRAAVVEVSPRYCALILERAERYNIRVVERRGIDGPAAVG
jgi:DNA modification methylase